MQLKILDYPAILLSLSITIVVAVYAYAGDSGPPHVRIRSAEKVFVYTLDTDREIAVEGPIGTTLVHIHDGKAAIVDSPCPNKLCVQAGELSKPGDWSACMPNKVFVQVEGDPEKEEVDATAY
jgi:hypothetical protein